MDLEPTEMAARMEELMRQKVDVIFPKKQVRVSSDDQPFITAEIKKLDKYLKKRVSTER